MAKAKSDLLAEAQAAGFVASDASEDDFTVAQLETILGASPVTSAAPPTEPVVAPDGHVVLSQEDIDSRG